MTTTVVELSINGFEPSVFYKVRHLPIYLIPRRSVILSCSCSLLDRSVLSVPPLNLRTMILLLRLDFFDI